LGVAFADFEIPICCKKRGLVEAYGYCFERYGGGLLVLFRPPALAGTVSGSLIILAARKSLGTADNELKALSWVSRCFDMEISVT